MGVMCCLEDGIPSFEGIWDLGFYISKASQAADAAQLDHSLKCCLAEISPQKEIY